MTIQHLTILGRPASKKNSRQNRTARNKKTGNLYSYTVPSVAHGDFIEDAAKQLLQYKRHHFKGPLSINYCFFQKGGFRQDADNAMASINDLLQDCGFFENDKQILSGFFIIYPNSSEWKTLVTIVPLDRNEQIP